MVVPCTPPGARRASLSLAVAVVSLAFASGCQHEHQREEQKPRLLVTSPLRRATTVTREFVAQVRAIQHIEVRALERGYLQGSFVDEGQVVQAGQRLFQLMPLVYQAELQKAQAEAERSQIEFANTKLLAERDIVSPNELALAKANLDRAKAEVKLASTHRGFTELRAPFTGMVGRLNARLGSLISEGDLLTTLSDNRTMWVYFNVAEADYLAFQRDAADAGPRTVRLRMANGELFDEPGTVETIVADFNNETGTIAFRAAFPNPKGLLRHGQTGKVILSTTIDRALVLPQRATFDVLDKKFVYVLDEQNVLHTRAITVSAELPHVYVVASGLDENDRVLLDGLRKVRDGAAIEPAFENPTEVLAHLEVPAE
jgi:membrane fusion protein (multidrug efflux system)